MGEKALMRVVLDTNVFLSALISPHGTSAIIYSAWRSGKFDVMTSMAQLEELRRASRYPKFKAVLQPSRVGILCLVKRITGSREITAPAFCKKQK